MKSIWFFGVCLSWSICINKLFSFICVCFCILVRFITDFLVFSTCDFEVELKRDACFATTINGRKKKLSSTVACEYIAQLDPVTARSQCWKSKQNKSTWLSKRIEKQKSTYKIYSSFCCFSTTIDVVVCAVLAKFFFCIFLCVWLLLERVHFVWFVNRKFGAYLWLDKQRHIHYSGVIVK